MAEVGKPGTNWKQIGPRESKKLAPLVRHYMKQAHPFTACVRDNTKRFGKERAERICAVVKDKGHRGTGWRGKSKEAEDAVATAIAGAQQRLEEIETLLGDGAAVELAEREADGDPLLDALAEGARADLDLIEVWTETDVPGGPVQEALEPVGLAPLQEMAPGSRSMSGGSSMGSFRNWDPRKHPRNALGQFMRAIGQLAPGQALRLPDGVMVRRSGDELLVGGKGGEVERTRLDSFAARRALTRSSSFGPAGEMPNPNAGKVVQRGPRGKSLRGLRNPNITGF